VHDLVPNFTPRALLLALDEPAPDSVTQEARDCRLLETLHASDGARTQVSVACPRLDVGDEIAQSGTRLGCPGSIAPRHQ
jgi:hypothetical protein